MLGGKAVLCSTLAPVVSALPSDGSRRRRRKQMLTGTPLKHIEAEHRGTIGFIDGRGRYDLSEVQADWIETSLQRYGALVFRNFGGAPAGARGLAEGLGRVVHTVEVRGSKYVGYHGELTYTPFPPDLLCFFCASASASMGGETALCDGVAALAALSPAARQFFETHRLRFLSSWSEEFLRHRLMVGSRADLERRLTELRGLRYVRKDDGVYELDYVTSAIRPTRRGATPAFVNSLIIALHDKRARPERAYVLTLESGAPLPPGMLESILAATDALTYRLRWQRGDFAVVDNSRMLHGRVACANENETARELINMHVVSGVP